MFRMFETEGRSLDALRPFGEDAPSGKKKKKEKRKVDVCCTEGLEWSAAHGLHNIPRHVNSKHRA